MHALFQLTTSGVLWSGSLRKCGVYQMVVKSRNVQLKVQEITDDYNLNLPTTSSHCVGNIKQLV